MHQWHVIRMHEGERRREGSWRGREEAKRYAQREYSCERERKVWGEKWSEGRTEENISSVLSRAMKWGWEEDNFLLTLPLSSSPLTHASAHAMKRGKNGSWERDSVTTRGMWMWEEKKWRKWEEKKGEGEERGWMGEIEGGGGASLIATEIFRR